MVCESIAMQMMPQPLAGTASPGTSLWQTRGFLPNCKQTRCLFAHENEKLRSFPALRAEDLASLRDEVAKLPGAL